MRELYTTPPPVVASTGLDLSLILPCYDEKAVLEESVREIIQTLDATRWSYEIIFVDDCSHDNTRELIQQTITEYSDRNLRYLFHDDNKGRGRTVTDGLLAARGRVAGYIDIDLEVHARYIPVCVLAIERGCDVATAYRIYRFYWKGVVRWVLSNGYIWLERNLLEVPLRDTETGFKFFDRAKILPLLAEIQDDRWFWDTEVMVRAHLAGLKITEIPCLFQRRFDKRSTVNPIRDTLDYIQKLWRFRSTVQQIRARPRAREL